MPLAETDKLIFFLCGIFHFSSCYAASVYPVRAEIQTKTLTQVLSPACYLTPDKAYFSFFLLRPLCCEWKGRRDFLMTCFCCGFSVSLALARLTGMFSADSLETGCLWWWPLSEACRVLRGERNFPLAKYTCVKLGYCLLSQRNHSRPLGRTWPLIIRSGRHKPRTLFAIGILWLR